MFPAAGQVFPVSPVFPVSADLESAVPVSEYPAAAPVSEYPVEVSSYPE